jgi:uncharacterized membrane protein
MTHTNDGVPPYVRSSQPQSHRATERIRSIEECNDLIGNGTRDLPVCSIMLQPTTLSRDPFTTTTTIATSTTTTITTTTTTTTEHIGLAVTLLTLIREVLGSNLGRYTGRHD